MTMMMKHWQRCFRRFMFRYLEPTKADLPQILELISNVLLICVTKDLEVHSTLLSDITEGYSWWIEHKDKAYCRICKTKGKVVGVILIKEFWSFSDLFVDPAYQKKGIGRTLIKDAIAVCREKSPKKKLMLNSSDYACGFYRIMGFVQTGKPRDLPGGCTPFEYYFE